MLEIYKLFKYQVGKRISLLNIVCSQVWNHFDAGTCPGKAVGVRIRLDNGVSGFIPIKNLSDSPVINPAERVQPGKKNSQVNLFYSKKGVKCESI